MSATGRAWPSLLCNGRGRRAGALQAPTAGLLETAVCLPKNALNSHGRQGNRP